jgi:hypothetical protein
MPSIGQPEVQEAGTGNLGPGQIVTEAFRQLRTEALGDDPRGRVENRREQHRRIRRVVALALALRSLDLWFDGKLATAAADPGSCCTYRGAEPGQRVLAQIVGH